MERRHLGTSPIVEFEIPQKSLNVREGGPNIESTKHNFINPFEWFSTLFFHFPRIFAKQFLGPSATIASAGAMLKAFWMQVPDHDERKTEVANVYPALLGIPLAQIWERVVPISVHGDGVGVARGTTVDALSWTGVLGQGSIRRI